MPSTQKLLDEAYASAHVCADITEKLSAKPHKMKDVEATEWLLKEARNLACKANAINNRATGSKGETIAP
jgi:hypothetical protein